MSDVPAWRHFGEKNVPMSVKRTVKKVITTDPFNSIGITSMAYGITMNSNVRVLGI